MRFLSWSGAVKPPRLLVIADVGGPSHYHLGDEAMLEANLHKFRQLVPGIAFTVLSRDPDWTSKHYGVESFSISQMPPVDSPEVASTLWTDWQGEEITKRLRDATGLVVSGGGNLCATWPEKILERAALLKHAQKSDIPTVILGQTLGPSLSPDQRRLLSGPLQRTEWLGVRDESSAALALSLGVSASRVHTQLDDAFFLDPLVVSDERTWELRDQRRPWIVVTLDASFGFAARERSLSLLAGQLDALADYLHAALVFVPHVGGVDAGDALSDVVAGRALAAQLRSKLLVLDLWQPREVRWLI